MNKKILMKEATILKKNLLDAIEEKDSAKSQKFAKKLSNLSREMSKKNPDYNPRFSPGDQVEFKMFGDGAKLLFKIKSINKSPQGIKFYNLQFIKVLELYKDDYVAPKSYNPFCESVDKRMVKA